MIGGLLFVLLPLFGGEPTARWALSPARAQIGEPVVCRLEIRAPLGSAVLLADEDPKLDPSWLLLESRRIERSERAGEIAIDLTWKLSSLEPGSRTPFQMVIPVETGSGRVQLEPKGGAIEVLAALAEGEDAPRPLKGFLPPPPAGPARIWIAATASALALGGVVLLLVLRQRRRARRAPAPELGPVERLARLERDAAAAPERARELVYQLTHLVREGTDARLESPRAALADEEWIRAVASDARLSEPARAAARRLLERADAVKYAQAMPSRFLVEELCADARAALAPEERAA